MLISILNIYFKLFTLIDFFSNKIKMYHKQLKL